MSESTDELTQEEIDRWAEGKSLQEISDAWSLDAKRFRDGLGLTNDDLPQGRGEHSIEDAVIQRAETIRENQEAAEAERESRREEQAAKARYADGLEVQRRFCARHPEFVPSPEAGKRLYKLMEQAGETTWTDEGLEAAYSNMLVEDLES
jgi:hypothetical protein